MTLQYFTATAASATISVAIAYIDARATPAPYRRH